MEEPKDKLRAETHLEIVWGGEQGKWIAQLACDENRLVPPEMQTDFLKTKHADEKQKLDEVITALQS
jgi:hypothetical protein